MQLSIKKFVDKLLSDELPSTNDKNLDKTLKEYSKYCNSLKRFRMDTIKSELRFEILCNRNLCNIISKM